MAIIRKSSKPLPLGTDTATGQRLSLAFHWLRTHLHLIGPTNSGKSRLLLWLFQLLCPTNRPLLLVDFKGDLFRMARDWTLTHGYTKRVVLFDLSAEMLPGYNPLRENGMRLDLQAQWVAEGIKSAWGQASFDQTPQLARMLYLCLYVSRALSISLVEGLDVLRPTPFLRLRALGHIKDPFVHGALWAFDQLTDRRKEELAASTLARLEAFCRDEIVRKVICSPQSLELETLLSERKIILINFAQYDPLLPEQVKLLARMFTSDLLAHVYKGHSEGRFDEHNPVYFLCDEVQNMATRQLCDILDEGRGIGLHCILAHQHLSQLALEDQSGYLLQSVMNDARTKIIFGDLAYEDLEVLAKNVMLDRYNFWPEKDQLGKTARLMTTNNRTHSTGRATAWPTSETAGAGMSNATGKNRSRTRGTQENIGGAHTTAKSHSRSLIHTSGQSDTRGNSSTDVRGSGHVENRGSSQTSDASTENPLTKTTIAGVADSLNQSHADTYNDSHTDSSSVSDGTVDTHSQAHTLSHLHGTSQAENEGESENNSSTFNLSLTKGTTPSESEQWGDGVSTTIQPLSPDEQTLLFMQVMKDIPERHFLLKVPRTTACIIHALTVPIPRVTSTVVESNLERVYALPFYTHRDASVSDVEAQEIRTPQQTIFPRLPDPEHTPPAAGRPPVGPTTFRRKRRPSET